MKKIFALVLVAVLVLSLGTAVLAQGNNAQNSAAQAKLEQQKAKLEQLKANLEKTQAMMTEIKSLGDQLRANNQEIAGIRLELNKAIVDLRLKVIDLKQNPTKLTQPQIDSLKASLKAIRDERLAFSKDHNNKIVNMRPDLQKAKKDRNLDEVKACFEKMFTEQSARKTDLQKILDEVKATASELENA